MSLLTGLILILGGSSVLWGQIPPGAKPVKKVAFKIYHVAAKHGEKPVIPKLLTKFKKQLRVTGNQYRLLSKKPLVKVLTPGSSFSFRLPQKMGTGKVAVLPDGSAEVTLIPAKKKSPKDLIRSRHRRFPVFLVSERFRIGNEQYVFVLEPTVLPPEPTRK